MGLACAAYVAATLQGSRLPEDAAVTSTAISRAGAEVAHRAGTGSDKDEYPPLADNVTT